MAPNDPAHPSKAFSTLDEDEQRLLGPYLTSTRPSGDEWKGYCWNCEDPTTSKSPSASYNFIKGQWNCLKEKKGGAIAAAIRALRNRSKETPNVINIEDKRAARKAPSRDLPTDQQILGYMAQLRAQSNLLQIMEERRGLTPATLERFHIGFDATRKRYTVPVYDVNGNLVNVRLYNPLAKGDTPKMLPFARGYETQLFYPTLLKSQTDIVLCEGEMDCLILNQHEIPAMTHTGGAGAFQMSWAAMFKDKRVFICFDEDDAGRKGALRTAQMLRDVAAGVFMVVGLNTGKSGGDVTDFFLEGGTAEQFRALMAEAEERPFAQDDSEHSVPLTGLAVSLEESQNPEYHEPLEVVVMIAGKQTPPYVAPRRIHARCDMGKGKICTVCPMAAYKGDRVVEIPPDDQRLLQFVDTSDVGRRNVQREWVNAMCNDHIEFELPSSAGDTWSLEELVVTQSVEHRSEDTENPISRKVFNVGTYNTPVNSTARLVGKQVADPRNSRGILHSWHLDPVQANIDKFVVTDELIAELAVFQYATGQTPLDKCREIAGDIATNVTHIYGRDMLHIAYDLVFHSVLDFEFNGRRIGKGWLECLVIGDTRTGKSETALALTHHYNAGILKSCEGATFAGLVGGATQSPQGKTWMVTWGTIPLNDRRLVILDELSGLMKGTESKGIIEQMSSIRSSGKAALTKIVKEETSARTRLIWISNPLDGKRVAEASGGGMDLIAKLIQNPEDIARFDFALSISNKDVPSALINTAKHEAVEHVYTSDLCQKLVMWAWSRKHDQVRWYKTAQDDIIRAAEDLGNRYQPDPPLVQVENIRMKLARLAVAIAARTFSASRNGEVVVVTPECVTSAVEFLDWIYGTEAMGYARRSRSIVRDRAIGAGNRKAVLDYLKHNPGVQAALRAVMLSDSFRPRDFDEFGGLEVDARTAVKLLHDWRMLRRLPQQGGRIVFEPALVEVMRKLEEE